MKILLHRDSSRQKCVECTCGPRGCDFRAMPSLCRPVPSLVSRPWPGKQPSLVWEAPFLWSSPSCGPSQPLFCGPRDPMFSFVVRAAAANVNPRTRLSHVTSFIVCDWCTRERCRQNPRFSQIFPEFPADDPQDFAAGSRIPQDFPRKSEARAHHPHPHH